MNDTESINNIITDFSFALAPSETILIKYNNKVLITDFYELFNKYLSDINSESSDDESIKDTSGIDLEVYDKDGWTKINYVVSKLSYDKMYKISTLNNNLLVTNNYPLINYDKSISCASDSRGKYQFISNYNNIDNWCHSYIKYYQKRLFGLLKSKIVEIPLNRNLGLVIGSLVGSFGRNDDFPFYNNKKYKIKLPTYDFAFYVGSSVYRLTDAKFKIRKSRSGGYKLIIKRNKKLDFIINYFDLENKSANCFNFPDNIFSETNYRFSEGFINGLFAESDYIVLPRNIALKAWTLLTYLDYKPQLKEFNEDDEYENIFHHKRVKLIKNYDRYEKTTGTWDKIYHVCKIDYNKCINYNLSTESSTFICNGVLVKSI